MNQTFYKSEKWLNNQSSPSSGSVVCYDGFLDYTDRPDDCTYFELADCSKKVRLHKAFFDTTEDFIKKMKLLHEELSKFINHLEHKYETN